MTRFVKQADGFYYIPIVDLGTRLRDNFGLTIKEHSHFDTVDDVHAPNSYHYYDEAIDVQDWRGGSGDGAEGFDGVGYVQRTKNLRDLLRGSGAEVIGPGDMKGHETHLHLAAKGGVFKLNQQQYDYLFGGNAGGKMSTFSGFTPPGTPAVTPPATPKSDSPEPAQVVLRQTAKSKANEYKKFTASEVVKGFGNDFGSMKSSRLGKALAGAQESIIQKRMDNGIDFGGKMVEG